MAPYVPFNSSTATLTSNLLNEGRVALIDPFSIVAGPTGTPRNRAFIDMGLFPTDQDLSPVPNLTTEDRKAAGRTDGTNITVGTSTTDINIEYAIRVLNPDDAMRELYAGAAPATESSGALNGVTAYSYSPGALVTARFVVVRQTPNSGYYARVIWHPRVTVQGNGETTGTDASLNLSIGPVPYVYTPGAAFVATGAKITQYGAQFIAHTANELGALLTALAGEATT